MYKNKTKSPPTLVSAGIVTINVSKIIFNLLALLISLNILDILKALINVVAAPRVILVNNVIKIDPIVPTTTTKSKIFHFSSKYFLGPKPNNFSIASIVKIEANP